MWLFKHAASEMRAPHKFKRSPTIHKCSISEMRQGSGAGIHPQPALLRRRGQAAPGRGVRTTPPGAREEASRTARWNGAERGEGGGRGAWAHLARGAVRRARRRLCSCGSSATGHSAPGHSAPAQREGPRRPAPEFLRPGPRRAGSAKGARSCRQRLSTIPGPSRRRSPPGGPRPRRALAELGSAPRRPITHSS